MGKDDSSLGARKAFESMLRLGVPGYAIVMQTHFSIRDNWLHVYTTAHANVVTICGLDMVADSRSQWHAGGDFMRAGRWCPLCVRDALKRCGGA
ncbi:MAG: hypothetical protein ACTSX8_03540 [Alphaproteobacteria bacterium]